MKTKLEIQEQTFQNISREIHDNIGLSLTLAKLNLNTLELGCEKHEKILSTIELIGQALNDLSDISKSLNPEIISANGLLKVLEMEVIRINKTGIYNIVLQINGETKFLTSYKELIIYRIVQEALNNTIKHAKAKNVKIILSYFPEYLLLTFADDGIGFSEEEINLQELKINRAGLNNIKQRTKLISGNCNIESKKNEGTLISVSVPINN